MKKSKPDFAKPNLDFLGTGQSQMDLKSDDRTSKQSPKWSKESQALSNRVQQTYPPLPLLKISIEGDGRSLDLQDYQDFKSDFLNEGIL